MTRPAKIILDGFSPELEEAFDRKLVAETATNPFVIVELEGKTLTGHNFVVRDSRTGEQIGGNLSRQMALRIAAEEWAIENGEE